MKLRRAFFVPEVVQTSAMDCGPAALTSLLLGLGVRASYGRLREACQTDVDGTSIDTLEEIAISLGLVAEQRMLPPDHLFLPESAALPAIAMILMPGGLTHFVVVWSVHGGLLQIMDPAAGRRWISAKTFLRQLFIHRMPVSAEGFESWARSPSFCGALRRRLESLTGRAQADSILREALDTPGYQAIAELDAATRLTAGIVRARGLSKGQEAARALVALLEQQRNAPKEDPLVIPEGLWTARPGPTSAEGEQQVFLRGAVLISVSGLRAGSLAEKSSRSPEATPDLAPRGAAPAQEDSLYRPPSPELVAALKEPPLRPGRELLRLLAKDGALTPALAAAATVMASGGVLLEALVLRSLLGIGRHLGLPEQRILALLSLVILLLALLLIELPLASWLLLIGRRLEIRLRVAFLEKIPLLGDRYLHSRPASDMATRMHSVHSVRALSLLAGRMLRALLELSFTAAGLIWLSPHNAPLVLIAAGAAVLLPLAIHPALAERDLRQRTHSGALGRFYLDALLGLAPIRTHGAEQVVRREQEGLLVEWIHAGRTLARAAATAEALLALFGFGMAALLLRGYVARNEPIAGALLFAYWALALPMLGGEIAQLARAYPAQRNITLRLLEPLGALDESGREPSAQPASKSEEEITQPVSFRMEGVTVLAGGHVVLDAVNLDVTAGEHIAIVGPSGAGKSSLAGILLGFHRATSGKVLVNGAPLDAPKLAVLRRATAWVDPAVQIWNRSLFDNLTFGAKDRAGTGRILDDADLRGVLARLPEGLSTPLGEGGGLVSGGEGQRVRFGRALFRRDAQLVILDEPFRGLDRQARLALLARARERWAGATLLCITHDVEAAAEFGRALVIEGGRIVEDGRPSDLIGEPGSRLRALLLSEEQVREGLWSDKSFHRLTLRHGASHLEQRAAQESPNER